MKTQRLPLMDNIGDAKPESDDIFVMRIALDCVVVSTNAERRDNLV